MNNIRPIRKEKGITQRQIANELGTSVQYISDLERDRRTATQGTWEKIAEFLSVSVADLRGKPA